MTTRSVGSESISPRESRRGWRPASCARRRAAGIPAGLLTAMVLTEVINRRAFGWQIDLHLSPAQFLDALWLALGAALAAGAYPAWRSARAPLAPGMREE